VTDPRRLDTGPQLADVLPSVAGALGMPGAWDPLDIGDRWRHIVVLLVDGLGMDALHRHSDLAPTLLSGRVERIDAPVPTTTPTGLGSFGTGTSPGVHGLVGASFRIEGHHGLLHPLTWKDSPSPRVVSPGQTMFERMDRHGIAVSTIAPRHYANSGLTRAALRGGIYRGADGVGERLGELTWQRHEPRKALTYVYWPDLDRTGHGHGVDSVHWRAELQHVDDMTRRIVEGLGDDELLLVTADHGMVDVPDERRVDIDDVRSLRRGVVQIGGEPRCRYVYCRPGHAEEVAETWGRELGDRATVMTREDAVASGFFGDVEEHHLSRIGDVIAWAEDDWAMTSRQIDERVSNLIGQHGSTSTAERGIPLLRISGGACG